MTIAYYIASPTWGGGEQYVYDLSRHMKEHYGVTPIFIFPKHSSPAMVERFQEIGECPAYKSTGGLWRFLPFSGRRLAQVLDQYNVDVLHINSRQSYFISAWAKHFAHHPVRIIAVQHLVREAKNSLYWRWTYKKIDTLIFPSDCVKRAYLHTFGGHIPFAHTVTIHNSVPISSHEGIAQQVVEPKTIFYHGRICQEKGVFPLISYLEKLQDLDFRVVFAGGIDTQDKHHWEHILRTSPIRDRITYLGFRTDIAALIPHYQIGVIPTIVPEAGGPLALLENMALGLPTISSDNGSQPEFIQHEKNGLLCPPNDETRWIQAIRQLLTQPQQATQIAQQAQDDFFNHFGYEQFIKQMHTVYQLS
ncbi:MAG: glycosyltransferase family 4 protein [Paludibacteraceae bacterium]|nr:glycosyltransferase family 4 protein [Paludibacteraceae bacterium]